MTIDWVIIIFLLVLGLAFLVAEVIFVPGTTIVGIVGLIAMIYGIYHSYSTFGDTVGHWVLLGSGIAGVAAVVLSLRSKAWEKFSLNKRHLSRVNEDVPVTFKKGDRGEAISSLRPMGTAEFNGVQVEVTSTGGHISRGEKLEVVKVTDRKVYVERITIEEEWEEQ